MHDDPYNPCTPGPTVIQLEIEADERAAAEEADAARVIPRAVVLTYSSVLDSIMCALAGAKALPDEGRYADEWLVAEETMLDLETGDRGEATEIMTFKDDDKIAAIITALHAAERRGLPCYWIDPAGDGTPEELTGDWRAMHQAELARLRCWHKARKG